MGKMSAKAGVSPEKRENFRDWHVGCNRFSRAAAVGERAAPGETDNEPKAGPEPARLIE